MSLYLILNILLLMFQQYKTVREILLNEKTKQGSKLLKILEDDNQLFHENHRRSLVRLVVAELVSFQKSQYAILYLLD